MENSGLVTSLGWNSRRKRRGEDCTKTSKSSAERRIEIESWNMGWPRSHAIIFLAWQLKNAYGGLDRLC